MKTNIKHLSVLVALCGFAMAGSANAATTGPQADPYWSQFAPKEQPVIVTLDEIGGPQADAYWSQFLPHDQDERAVVASEPEGPQADAYWSQFLPG